MSAPTAAHLSTFPGQLGGGRALPQVSAAEGAVERHQVLDDQQVPEPLVWLHSAAVQSNRIVASTSALKQHDLLQASIRYSTAAIEECASASILRDCSRSCSRETSLLIESASMPISALHALLRKGHSARIDSRWGYLVAAAQTAQQRSGTHAGTLASPMSKVTKEEKDLQRACGIGRAVEVRNLDVPGRLSIMYAVRSELPRQVAGIV